MDQWTGNCLVCFFILGMMVNILVSCDPNYRIQELAAFQIILNEGSRKETLLERRFPKDIGIVIETPNGFESWDDVLQSYSGVELEVALQFSSDESLLYHLLIDEGSGVRLMKFDRGDGTVDLGWRLVNDAAFVQSVAMQVSKPGTMQGSRVRIRLLKFP